MVTVQMVDLLEQILDGGVAGPQPSEKCIGFSHLDAADSLVVVSFRSILQPDWALPPPAC